MRLFSVTAIFLLGALASLWAEEGRAVRYSNYYQGRLTANQERFDQEGLTAAHKTLPFGTLVKLTNLANHKSVIVRINDRMPPHNGNLIDVTARAARELDFLRPGTARVSLEIIREAVKEVVK